MLRHMVRALPFRLRLALSIKLSAAAAAAAERAHPGYQCRGDMQTCVCWVCDVCGLLAGCSWCGALAQWAAWWPCTGTPASTRSSWAQVNPSTLYPFPYRGCPLVLFRLVPPPYHGHPGVPCIHCLSALSAGIGLHCFDALVQLILRCTAAQACSMVARQNVDYVSFHC